MVAKYTRTAAGNQASSGSQRERFAFEHEMEIPGPQLHKFPCSMVQMTFKLNVLNEFTRDRMGLRW